MAAPKTRPIDKHLDTRANQVFEIAGELGNQRVDGANRPEWLAVAHAARDLFYVCKGRLEEKPPESKPDTGSSDASGPAPPEILEEPPPLERLEPLEPLRDGLVELDDVADTVFARPGGRHYGQRIFWTTDPRKADRMALAGARVRRVTAGPYGHERLLGFDVSFATSRRYR